MEPSPVNVNTIIQNTRKGVKRKLTVNIDCSELSLNEELESLRELIIGLAFARGLHSLHKLVGVNLVVLVEVGDIADLLPEVDHHLLVLLVLLRAPFPLTLKDGVPHSETLEVILVQDSVTVIVVHVSK